jgi:hypothetical protein
MGPNWKRPVSLDCPLLITPSVLTNACFSLLTLQVILNRNIANGSNFACLRLKKSVLSFPVRSHDTYDEEIQSKSTIQHALATTVRKQT